jgi:hypothetical protein
METLSSLLLSAVHLLGVQLALQALVQGGHRAPAAHAFLPARRVYQLPFEVG